MFKIKLRENEKVILISRQTEWVWGKTVLLVLALIYLPWAFYSKYELLGITSLRRILFLWIILISLYAVNRYLLWLVNAYAITNQRVVSVSYKNLFSKTVEEADLQSVVSIACSTKGLAGTFFKTGKVTISFANAAKSFELDRVREPEILKELILKVKTTGRPRHV